MRMNVADLMCETPITVGPQCTADQALDTFYEYEVSELYVVDKTGRFLGILPDYELLKAQLSGEAALLSVSQLMSRGVPVVAPGTDAAEVIRSFRECRCSRLPVVKSGRLIGVVTRSDVLRLMAVMRRVEPVETKSTAKRPKFLPINERTKTRSARARTVNLKSTPKRSRSKPATRRSSVRS